MDRIAVLADIHGNRWALEAVLEDAARREVDAAFDLGDSLHGPLDPAGTAALLRRLAALSVRGNQDRLLLHASASDEDSPTTRYARRQLSAADLAWLAGHRAAPILLDELALCHGTPLRDDRYLLEEVGEHGVTLGKPAVLRRRLGGLAARIVLCAHSHVPRLVALPDGRLVVNPGSVGLPAYTEDYPYPHGMEAGSPHARYVLLERTDAGWTIEHIAVPYDWAAAAAAAERNGRPDWAGWLRTGRAAPG